jgi:hypothetical protein
MRAAMMGPSQGESDSDDRPLLQGSQLLLIASLDYDPKKKPRATDQMEVEETTNGVATTMEASTSDQDSKITTRTTRARPSLVGNATADWFPHVPEQMDPSIADLPDDPLLPPDTFPDSSMLMMPDDDLDEDEAPLGMRWAKRFPYTEDGIKCAKEWVRKGVPAVLSGFPLISFSPHNPPCPYATSSSSSSSLF